MTYEPIPNKLKWKGVETNGSYSYAWATLCRISEINV